MSAYNSFADMPPSDRHEDALVAWLRTPAGNLAEIPKDLLTRKMQVAAIWTEGSLSNFSFKDNPNYCEIVLEAIIGGGTDLILQVEEEALSEPFLYAAVSTQHTGKYILCKMVTECCDRFNRLISQRIMNKGLENSLKIAWEIMHHTDSPIPQSIRDMVTDKVLRDAIVNNTCETYYLKRMGKLHLLTQALEDGYWPAHDMWLRRRAPEVMAGKPGLSVAIEQRMRPDTSDSGLGLFDRHFHAFYEAVILTFPIEDVLAKLTPREHGPLLKELYSTQALMPYLRTYPHLKAMVLEDAMGL